MLTIVLGISPLDYREYQVTGLAGRRGNGQDLMDRPREGVRRGIVFCRNHRARHRSLSAPFRVGPDLRDVVSAASSDTMHD